MFYRPEPYLRKFAADVASSTTVPVSLPAPGIKRKVFTNASLAVAA